MTGEGSDVACCDGKADVPGAAVDGCTVANWELRGGLARDNCSATGRGSSLCDGQGCGGRDSNDSLHAFFLTSVDDCGVTTATGLLVLLITSSHNNSSLLFSLLCGGAGGVDAALADDVDWRCAGSALLARTGAAASSKDCEGVGRGALTGWVVSELRSVKATDVDESKFRRRSLSAALSSTLPVIPRVFITSPRPCSFLSSCLLSRIQSTIQT
jgi:hypothetical protein